MGVPRACKEHPNPRGSAVPAYESKNKKASKLLLAYKLELNCLSVLILCLSGKRLLVVDQSQVVDFFDQLVVSPPGKEQGAIVPLQLCAMEKVMVHRSKAFLGFHLPQGEVNELGFGQGHVPIQVTHD